MSARNDGGPAFAAPDSQPNGNGDVFPPSQPGMSLRDYFAAKAMHALIAEPAWAEGAPSMMLNLTKGGNYESDAERVSAAAYRVADAMLRARGDQ